MELSAVATAALGALSQDEDGDEDSERCLLLALSHDELGVIFDGLADPLQPAVAVALSSTCLGLRTPLMAALEVLKERHERAVALCRKAEMNCAELRDADRLSWFQKGLTAVDLATLGILLSKWLPRLQTLDLDGGGISDAGMQALCGGLALGAAPSLSALRLSIFNDFGPVGAEALAAALRRGAMPHIEKLYLSYNPIGSQGMAALAAPLRKLPSLNRLGLINCKLGDEGVASMFANLGKDDFKALQFLQLDHNELTETICATLVAAINADALPNLRHICLSGNPASDAARLAVTAAICARAEQKSARAQQELAAIQAAVAAFMPPSPPAPVV